MSTIQRATGNQVEIDEDDELRPSEVFDFICGSGMGGVFAILFSVFQYTANEAINFYLELHERVFSTKTWTQKTRNESAFLLKNTILELLPVDVLEQKFVTADESRSRTLVCAANSKNHAHARLLRTYKSREDPLSCTVLDAILLSIADEDHLDPYPLGQFKELFTGSGHRNSNPTQYVLREICAVFNGVAGALMSCIVNIGKGNPGALTTVNSTDGYLGILRDCEESANDIARQFSGCTNLFFRLSVPQGFQTPAYDIGTVAAHTNSYLAGSECESVTQSLGSHLCHRPGILNVHEIMTYRPSAISPPDDAANPYLSPLGNGERHDPNNSELIQTYIEEGYKWKFGIPLWDPQPTGKVVEIGDVGILTEDGGFCTLFNATVPEDKQQQYRLPPNFSPLELAEGDIEILPAPGARQYLSAGRMLKLPANNQPQFTRGPFKLPFQISHGAVLILKDSPTKITTPRDFHIQQYIERNIENWYAFCKEGLGRDLCGQALMFVTEIRRGFDWALGAWPDLGVEKSISYAGKSTASINNPRGVKGSWIPSHFAFKDGPFGNGPLVDEPKCPHNAFYPNMDETLGKHCVFLKCYRLGFRPLYMLPIQITVPTVSEPKTSWRDYLRQLFPTVLETCRNVVGSSSPPAPSSALQDAFFAPASFLSKVGYGIPPRHPLDDVIEEVFHNVTDAQAVIIHDDEFEALKRSSVVGQPTNNFQLNLSQSGRCVSFTFSVPALPLYDLGPLIAQIVIENGDTSTARNLCVINKQMNKTCIPLLYHAVKLDTLEQLRGFVDAVSSSTRLALLVRTARVAVDPSSFSPVFQHCTNLTELTILKTYNEGQQQLELPISVTKLLCDAEYFTPTRRPFAPDHNIFQNITHFHLLTKFTKQEMWTWLGHECFPSLSHLAVVHNDDGDLCNAAQDCVDLLKNLPDQVQVCALMFVPSHNLVSVMDQNTIELSDGTVDPRVVVITSTPKVIGSPLGYVMTFNPEDPAVIGLESTENDIFKAAQHTIKMRRINGRYPKEYYSFHSRDSDGRSALSRASEKGYSDAVQFLLAQYDVNVESRDSKGRTPLSWACKKGHADVVKLFLARDDVELNSRDEFGQTPLSLACENGHLDVVQILIAQGGVNVDLWDCQKRTALSWACVNGHPNIVKLLIARDDVEVDSRDNQKQTPLSWACVNGHLDIVQLLVARGGVEFDSQDGLGRTPLSWACANGHLDVVKHLLAQGSAEVDSKDHLGRTPLLLACGIGQLDVVELLITRDDVESDSHDGPGRTPLSWACGNGHLDVAQLLVARDDVEVDSKDRKRRSPLLWACVNGHLDIVRFLFGQSDVNVNSRDSLGRTPLSWACVNGHLDVVKFLIARDAVELNSHDERGQTPFSLACKIGRLDVVNILITRHDVEADSRDRQKRTALWWACANGYPDVVELLITRDDVELDSQDEFGQTPLSSACENGHLDVVQLFVARGNVEFDSHDDLGRTPLSWACINAHFDVVKLLIGIVDVNSKDSLGRTPLLLACGIGHLDVVQLLVDRDDVKVDSHDSHGRTPLSWACGEGQLGVALHLVARSDVDIDSKDKKRRTPLSWACKKGHLGVVQFLVAGGAFEIDSQDSLGRTPLSWACMNGHLEVVKLLTARNDVRNDSGDVYGRTPLSHACENGHYDVVEHLIGYSSVRVVSHDYMGQSPLSFAHKKGHLNIVALLLGIDGTGIYLYQFIGLTSPYVA